ncbi:HNH endonuclease [Streptomyces radicis]|uniref:HNH endonuclease n=1 Tax=Streptomyces radicis TaxID=1750517 RepID=A0A3A9WBA7_9ACTN|nr:HNH endonuclease [Streptomyces radicis]
MAWATSNRRQRLPDDWPTRRAAALRRDGFRCVALLADGERCTEPATDVDHIVPGDDHALTNLQSLCSWHHARKSAREGQAANRAKQRPSRRRPDKPHPGEVR